ncbi:collagenase family protein, partial [Vibrio parahaemolyticus V-223/04]
CERSRLPSSCEYWQSTSGG